jgi:hypothetical protein
MTGRYLKARILTQTPCQVCISARTITGVGQFALRLLRRQRDIFDSVCAILAAGLPDLRCQAAILWCRCTAEDKSLHPQGHGFFIPMSLKGRCATESSLPDSLEDRCQFVASANGKRHELAVAMPKRCFRTAFGAATAPGPKSVFLRENPCPLIWLRPDGRVAPLCFGV